MSVLHLILCDGPGPDGDGCNVEADRPSPTLRGYRRSMSAEGWAFDRISRRDLCPACVRRVREATRD